MSRLLSSRVRSFYLALGGALVCALMTGVLAAGQRGRPIEFSAPTNEGPATNAGQPGAKLVPDELLQQELQEDLLGSLGIFGAKGSLNGESAGPLHPPTRLPAQNQRAKELLERHKNWAFRTPDDFNSEQTLDEHFKFQKDDHVGLEEKAQSPLERYYESLDRKKLGGTSRQTDSFSEPQDNRRDDEFSSSHDPAEQDNALLQTEKRLRNLFSSDSASGFSARGYNASIFYGLSGSSERIPVERTPSQDARMEEFKQLLEPRFPVTPPAALANPLNPQPGLAGPASVLGTQPNPVGSPLFGSVNAEVGTRSGGLPGMNAGSASPSSFSPVLPAEPPRVASPVLTIPKRKF
jgi:hypothetical protein